MTNPKFQIQTKFFKKALIKLNPHFDKITIEVIGGINEINMYGYGNMSVMHSISAEVSGSFVATTYTKVLRDVVKKANGKYIDITFEENKEKNGISRIVVNDGVLNMYVPLIETEEIDKDIFYDFTDSSLFKESNILGIKRTSKYCKKDDTSHLREVFVVPNGDNTDFFASDGHRLHMFRSSDKLEIPEDNLKLSKDQIKLFFGLIKADFIIGYKEKPDTKDTNTYRKFIPTFLIGEENSGDVTINTTVKSDGAIGNTPPYKRIIPKFNNLPKLYFDKKDLKRAVKTLKSFTTKKERESSVKYIQTEFLKDEDKVDFTLKSKYGPDVANVSVNILKRDNGDPKFYKENFEGKEFITAWDSGYLTEAVQDCQGEFVTIAIQDDEKSPITIYDTRTKSEDKIKEVTIQMGLNL